VYIFIRREKCEREGARHAACGPMPGAPEPGKPADPIKETLDGNPKRDEADEDSRRGGASRGRHRHARAT
jgi:hypothetical protein